MDECGSVVVTFTYPIFDGGIMETIQFSYMYNNTVERSGLLNLASCNWKACILKMSKA